jgi:CRP-like cAMP-binding protein
VVKGAADIVVETDGGEIVVAQAKENAVIGEIAILCDVPRTATVRANGELVALKIKKEHFLSLMTDFPKLGIQVMRELARRLSNTTAELTDARRRLAAQKAG